MARALGGRWAPGLAGTPSCDHSSCVSPTHSGRARQRPLFKDAQATWQLGGLVTRPGDPEAIRNLFLSGGQTHRAGRGSAPGPEGAGLRLAGGARQGLPAAPACRGHRGSPGPRGPLRPRRRGGSWAARAGGTASSHFSPTRNTPTAMRVSQSIMGESRVCPPPRVPGGPRASRLPFGGLRVRGGCRPLSFSGTRFPTLPRRSSHRYVLLTGGDRSA